MTDTQYWETLAREAREIYWSSIDELERATTEPSPESLRAWVVVAKHLGDKR